MRLTDFHAKYLAWDLTLRRLNEGAERLTVAVAGSQVDLNPHQVDAALFAFASPLSHGALLADEVGLGKTIEAGLIIAQRWAEQRRRILVIAPSNLRKHWRQELGETFFIPCEILESRSFNDPVKAGGKVSLLEPLLGRRGWLAAEVRAVDALGRDEDHLSRKRRSLFDAQDEVDGRRADLIADIERRMMQTESSTPLVTLRWAVR